MTPEGIVKAKIIKILKAYGVYYFMPAGTGRGRSGIPDIICCVKGKFIAIEVKSATGKLTELQKYELEKITEAGGVALVINGLNMHELTDALEK